jgi:hypothetical protein
VKGNRLKSRSGPHNREAELARDRQRSICGFSRLSGLHASFFGTAALVSLPNCSTTRANVFDPCQLPMHV